MGRAQALLLGQELADTPTPSSRPQALLRRSRRWVPRR